MADIAVSLLIERLADFLEEKVQLYRDVGKEARELKKDLESMQSWLEAADRSAAYNDIMKTWVNQVKEAACDAEDALDEYVLRLEENRGGCFGRIKQLKYGPPVASKIRDIKNQIREIRDRKQFYFPAEAAAAAASAGGGGGISDPRACAPLPRETELVGIDAPRGALIEMLTSGEEESRGLTIAVVGMGGVGKTTLVRSVYEHVTKEDKTKDQKKESSHQFETHAWISVSKTFQGMDILGRMLVQFRRAFKGQQDLPGEGNVLTTDPCKELRAFLENKRFLLVLDDVWDVNAWKYLRTALPPTAADGGHGGRVIITTRIRDVAKISDCIFALQPLDPCEAWTLFCRNAFQSDGDGDDENCCCPQGMQEVARKIVAKCGGLPLAIVALGSHLSHKSPTYQQWNMILSSLGPELETDDGLKTMTKILLLSFNDLAYAVKSCFLFLSIFPEDYAINRMKLIRLWIAEGLIKAQKGRSLEEVADGYLHQLIRRNLVQVSEWKHGEMVKTCQVHDIVREIIIYKYEEDGFFASSSSSSPSPVQRPSNRIRHLTICNSKKGTEINATQRYENFTRLRSLFTFRAAADNAVPVTASSFARLRLLRVVSLENIPMDSFPDGLTQLLLLRYLSLENTNINKLPDSVGKLKHLQTLNLKGTMVRELPAAIHRLQSLRHLLVYKYGQGTFPFNSIGGVRLPPGIIRKLWSLQKLGYIVAAESGVVAELGNLTQLRGLCVVKLSREDGNDFCTSVAKMSHLQALNVTSVNEDEVVELQSLSSPLPALQRLYLSGRFRNLHQWIPSLDSLLVLCLQWSKLKDDPLKALQSLPNLVRLELINAYDGEELCCKAGGYPKLKELHLHELIGLKQVEVEKGAMPNLALLCVSSCQLLLKVPSCLQHLANMQLLNARYMPKEFELSLFKDGGEGEMVDYVRHIPQIHFRYHAS